MQPKTGKHIGWFGLLMIATLSGLIIKVVGDPLIEVLDPKLEDAADEVEDWFKDREWGETIGEWLNS